MRWFFIIGLWFVLVVVSEQAAVADRAFGLMIDGGAPDGVNASLAYRISPRFRTHAGISFNGIAPGARVGVSVAAFPYWITPSISLEAGHLWEGNGNDWIKIVAGDESADEPVLRKIGYDFASAHLGVEVGDRRLMFYFQGGMSVVQLELHDVETSIAEVLKQQAGSTLEVRGDVSVRIIAPAGRAGLICYF